MKKSSLIALTKEDDARCACGWKLPLFVTPLDHRGKMVSGGRVSLECPECGDGHVFYGLEVPAGGRPQ